MTVLIADDDHAYRTFLKHVLTLDRGFQVVGEASDAEEAIERVETLKPDVVLMDLDLPTMDGLQATRTIKTRMPKTRVIIISGFEGEAYRNAARKYGADGFVPKDAEISRIIATIAGGSRQNQRVV